MDFKFNKEVNYIGATNFQRKLTSRIAKKQPEINFTAFKHDYHYYLMMGERNHLIRLITKIMYDLLFLVLGITRCLRKFHLRGVVLIIILYALLLISTPVYLLKTRKQFNNLS